MEKNLQFCFKGENPYFHQGERARYVTGINYLPSYLFDNFWADFREEHIREDMRRVAAMGLSVVRVPVYWDYWEPAPGEYNREMVSTFRCFLDILAEFDLYVMPWFLVGVCGSVSYPEYLEGKNLLDEDLQESEANHLKAFVSESRDSDRIFAWDLTDEPYFAPFSADHKWVRANPDRSAAWVAAMGKAVNEGDPGRLTTIGLHGAAPQCDYGFYPEMFGDAVDFFGPGGSPRLPYGGPIDRPQGTLWPPFLAHFHTSLSHPAMLTESPMYPSTLMANSIIAGHYRSSLPVSLGVGAAGAMPWVLTDFEEHEHYRAQGILRAGHEGEWGILKADRTPKAQADVLSEFAHLMKKVDLTGLRPEAGYGQLVLSAKYNDYLADNTGKGGDSLFAHFGGYVLATTSGVSWGMIREPDAPGDSGLLYLPGWTHTHPHTNRRVLDAVGSGTNVIASFGSDYMLTPLSSSLYGIEVQHLLKDTTAVEFDGLSLQLPEVTRVIVEPEGSRVVARFSDGNPAVLIHEAQGAQGGKAGKAVFVAFPLERAYVYAGGNASSEETFRRFFGKLLDLVEPQPAFRVHGLAASLHVLAEGNRKLLIITNHLPQNDTVVLSASAVQAELRPITSGVVHGVSGRTGEWKVDLEPNGYALLEVGGGNDGKDGE